MIRLSVNALRQMSAGGPLDTPISRREMLALSGAACVAAPAIADVLRLPNEYTVVGDERRIAFLVSGLERWVIDPAAFDGNPRLTVRNSETAVHVRLEGARYPGTRLCADMNCDIRRSIGRWRIHLRLEGLAAECEGSFIPWLVGAERLSCAAAAAGMLLSSGRTRAYAAAGHLTFAPDWTIGLTGEAIVTIERPEGVIAAERARIALLAPDAISMIEPRPEKRTGIAIERGTRAPGRSP